MATNIKQRIARLENGTGEAPKHTGFDILPSLCRDDVMTTESIQQLYANRPYLVGAVEDIIDQLED